MVNFIFNGLCANKSLFNGKRRNTVIYHKYLMDRKYYENLSIYRIYNFTRIYRESG